MRVPRWNDFVACVLLASAAGLLANGCELSDSGCTSDAECREGRVCEAGLCVGDVDVADRNNDPDNNNEPDNNNNEPDDNNNNEPDDNNNEPDDNNNNEPNNNENNGPDDNNNNEPAETCENFLDCDEPRVCKTADDGTRQCVLPERICTQDAVDTDGDFCVAVWLCEDGLPYILECDFGDQDDGFCVCVAPEGEAIEFRAPRDLCLDTVDLQEFVNDQCGWEVRR